MPEQELVALGIGVGSGLLTAGLATVGITRHHLDLHSEVTESLLVESIGQHAYLRATKEIVDDDTDEQIKERGKEILEEYDFHLINSQEVEEDVQ